VLTTYFPKIHPRSHTHTVPSNCPSDFPTKILYTLVLSTLRKLHIKFVTLFKQIVKVYEWSTVFVSNLSNWKCFLQF